MTQQSPSGRQDFGPASDRIIPISIRKDCTVHILDLPRDLTRAEADKIAAVVLAFASPGDPA